MASFLHLHDVVEDYVARRAPLRGEHLRLARESHARGELVLAGAHTDEADALDGAVLVFSADSADVARHFAESDPYVKNGLVT